MSEGEKVQVVADLKNFPDFQGDGGIDKFMALMNTCKRGDVIGVRGNPYKANKGELSIMPQEVQLLTPCLHMMPKSTYGSRARRRGTASATSTSSSTRRRARCS